MHEHNDYHQKTLSVTTYLLIYISVYPSETMNETKKEETFCVLNSAEGHIISLDKCGRAF